MRNPLTTLPLAGSLATLLASAAAVGTGGCTNVPPPEPKGLLSAPVVGVQQVARGSATKTTRSRRPIAARTVGYGAAEDFEGEGGSGEELEVGPITVTPGRLNDVEPAGEGGCRAGMVPVGDRLCVDRFEASVVEVLPSGEERFHSPYEPVDGLKVRAVSVPGRHPQGYISGKQAKRACAASGKRLCKPSEWKLACTGPERQPWGYGQSQEAGRCNDQGKSPITLYLASVRRRDEMALRFSFPSDAPQGQEVWSWPVMNSPALNQYENTLAPTGSHPGCTNGYGVYDMVGNLHEWVDDPQGTFLGGYYQDVTQNGDGCGYRTAAHEFGYHDYSTGFRCCDDR
jgi:sulfatase modifying factor 1